MNFKFMVRSLSITGNASNMKKAFADLFSLPGFTTVSEGAEYAESDSITEGDSDNDEDDVAIQSDSHLESIPGKVE